MLKAPRSSHWLFVIVLAAVAVRAWVYLRSPFSPGMNGAYYLVQARSLLEKGSLGIPDMPLTFGLHAALAWLLGCLGLAQAKAITLACKSLDSLLPPLVAVPVYLLAKKWPGSSAWTALAAAAAASGGVHSLTMLGDFEKNALALLWLGCLAWALHGWLSAPALRTAWPVVLSAALLGLTHVGTLGAACGFSGLAVLLALCLVEQEQRMALIKLVLCCALVLGAGVAVVYTSFDSERALRLVTALSDPTSLAETNHPHGPGPGIGRGGPRLGPALSIPHEIMLALSLVFLVQLIIRRKLLSPAASSVLAASALTAAILGGPWWGFDKGSRFILIAALPFCIAISGTMAITSWRWLRVSLVTLLLLYAAGSLVLHPQMGGHPMMSEAARDELLQVKALVKPGARSLIVARHGLEWWVSWFVGTHIAQQSGLTASAWQRYEAVYYLTEKRGPPGPMGQMMRGPMRGPGGPMRGPELPRSAEILHSGEHYTLARLPEVPDELRPPDFTAPWW